MGSDRIFIVTAKRIREIREIEAKDFRRLVGMMMRLRWEQEPIAKLYSLMNSKVKEMETEDLCYLVLYGQHVTRVNLMVLDNYIK